ncbi:NAD-dependent epimerase/dehydratase family protein [Candidatus Fermentibacteria bacterium]|nr:NAD-dependent epimerase/dehydratase family protein [Candidatus Fermentibacteria bacterium]
MAKDSKSILVTGAVGQIGSELTMALRERYGADNVVATGRKTEPGPELRESGPFYFIDVTERASLDVVVKKHDIDTVYHMAAILSAVGEKKPLLCWDVNMNGTINVLRAAMDFDMNTVIIPSSIAAFGPETPKENTPQETVLRPTTMYGVTKVAGELLCDYYVGRFGLDIRGLRYPGIISSETLPGGGTTDYAVEIYYKAVEEGSYECFVREDTRLPMMYMPDCIKSTIDLAEADFENLKHHSDFNVGSMSFTAKELEDSIRKHIPDFTCTYKPDYRQEIADSWPSSIDDSAAREEWGWEPVWDLNAMTEDMLKKLRRRHEEGRLYG